MFDIVRHLSLATGSSSLEHTSLAHARTARLLISRPLNFAFVRFIEILFLRHNNVVLVVWLNLMSGAAIVLDETSNIENPDVGRLYWINTQLIAQVPFSDCD